LSYTRRVVEFWRNEVWEGDYPTSSVTFSAACSLRILCKDTAFLKENTEAFTMTENFRACTPLQMYVCI